MTPGRLRAIFEATAQLLENESLARLSTNRIAARAGFAVGTLYQFNRYGPLRPGALGAGLKDRSVGTVIRGNWIEGGLHQLQLPEAQNQADLAVALPVFLPMYLLGARAPDRTGVWGAGEMFGFHTGAVVDDMHAHGAIGCGGGDDKKTNEPAAKATEAVLTPKAGGRLARAQEVADAIRSFLEAHRL